MTEAEANQVGAIALAFVGDAEYTRFIRRRLVYNHDFKSAELTRRANKLISAVYQSKMYEAVNAQLTETEAEIARRARNTHTPAHAKNAGLADYKRATALEAVFGYLSLTENYERLNELMELCLASVDYLAL